MGYLINPYILAAGAACSGDRVNLFGYGYFPLNGNANGNLTTGTTNAITWDDSFVSANFSSAATFNGTTSYINCGHDAVYAGSGSSISAFGWVNLTRGFSVQGNNHFLSKRQSSTAGWRIYFTDGGSGTANMVVTTQNVNQQASSAFNTGETVHVGFTYDNNIVRYYINGTEFGTNTPGAKTIATSASYNFGIGYNNLSTSASNFDGDIDDAVVFNRVLTPTEVSNIYDGGPTAGCPLSA